MNKNLRGIAKQIAKDDTLKQKYFIGLCNLSINKPLEKNYFIGAMPKIWYYAYFENMRKRKFEKNTATGIVMRWFSSLKPTEPETIDDPKKFDFKFRNSREHYVIGLFPNTSDPIYQEQYIEMSNFFSYIPVYTCFLPCPLADHLSITNYNDTNVIIYRKKELTPSDQEQIVVWDKSQNLSEFIEQNYHLPVDIYSHDNKYLYDLHSDIMGLFYYEGSNSMYHKSYDSPVSKLTMVLNQVLQKLEAAKDNFTSPDAIDRYNRFTLAL